MDYLYINAIVKETYVDLPCGCPFPSKFREYLRTYSTNDECLKAGAPSRVLTYFTVKDGEEPPVAILCSTEKHRDTVSVGRFTQCLGWGWGSDLIADNMDAIFGAGFYTEKEITETALRKEPFALPRNRQHGTAQLPLILDSEVKSAILTAVMVRWLRHEPILKIAVPANVDYDSYVLSAVNQIYALFPVSLRSEAGFCSYLPKNSDNLDRVYIGFIPEAQADSSTLFLDGSSRAVIAKLSKGTRRKALDLFIKYLSCAGAEQVRGFISEVFADVEGSGDGKVISAVAAKDYAVVGEVLNLLTLTGGADVLVPEWQSFYANPEKYSPNMQHRIRCHISESVQPNDCAAYFRTLCENATTPASIFEQLAAFRDICTDAPTLSDVLWNTALELIQSKNISFQNFHRGAAAKKDSLQPILDEEKLEALYCLALNEQLTALKGKQLVTLTEIDQANAQLAQWQADTANCLTPGMRQLHADLSGFINEVEAKRITIVLGNLSTRFQDLKARPAVSTSALKNQLASAATLLADVEKEPETEAVCALKAEVQQFIAEKETIINSSSSQFHQLRDIIAGSNDYFLILERLEKEKNGTAGLDQTQISQIEAELAKKRPATITLYKEDFYHHFKKELLLSSVAKLSDYLCKRIITDICALNSVAVSYNSSRSRAENLTDISGMKSLAGKISKSCAVKVSYDGKELNEAWFRRILDMSHTRDTAGDTKEFMKIFKTLVSSGTFSGSDMEKCVQMFGKCRIKVSPLFEMILQGRFKDATEKQYKEAYAAILAQIENGSDNALEDMNTVFSRTADKDKTASRAFTSFMQKGGSGGKKNKLIPIIVACVLVAAALIGGIVIWLVTRNNEPDPTEPPMVTDPTVAVTEPAPTPEEIYPAVFSTTSRYGAVFAKLHAASPALDFETYSNTVLLNVAQADEETRGLIAAAYENNSPISVEGASWDEYFFWVCWLNADNVSNIPAALAEPNPEALNILRFIHTYSLPEEVAETEPPTEAETVPAPEATEAATEAPTEAPTEPPKPTLTEILSITSGAAGAAYRIDPAAFGGLVQVQSLFGAAFDKSFDAHVEALEVLLTSGNQNQNLVIQELLLNHYRTLPGDTVIRFSDSGLAITWNEFVFWEFWLIAQNTPEQLNETVFNDQLRTDALEILDMIYNLSEGTAQFPAPETNDAASGENAEASEEDVIAAAGLTDAAEQARVSYETAASVYRDILALMAPVG